MGVIIDLVEYRKQRCLEALMTDIGLPSFCQECSEDFAALLLAEQPDDLALLEDFDDLLLPDAEPLIPDPQPARPPAVILPFESRQREPVASKRQSGARKRTKK